MGIKSVLSRSIMFAAAIAFSTSAGTVEEPFEVGTWGNFAKGAISHTFDDNTDGLFNAGVPAFNAKGFHLTSFVVINWMGEKWDKAKAAFEDGHEIGSHGVTHGSPEPASNLKPSQQKIQEMIPGEKCVSFAYPNLGYVNGTLDTYIASRSGDGNAMNSKTPSDWSRINSKGFGAGAGGYPNDVNSLNGFADAAASQNGWAVLLHHGVGNGDHNWGSTDLNVLKTHLDYLDKNRDKVWCETFGNVARYIRERDAASVKKKESGENSITVEVTDDLDDKTFNYPLSIRLPVKDDWDKPSVKQSDKEIEDTVVQVNGKEYLMFKAVPDGGDVVITTKEATGIKNGIGLNSTAAPISRVHSSLVINRQQLSNMVTVTLFDLAGKVISRHTLNNMESSISLINSSISRSAFIAKISDGTTTFSHFFPPEM